MSIVSLESLTSGFTHRNHHGFSDAHSFDINMFDTLNSFTQPEIKVFVSRQWVPINHHWSLDKA